MSRLLSRAVTMIEMVVVLVIVTILSATGYTAYATVVTKAHNEVALNELEQLHHVFWSDVTADESLPTALAASRVSEHTLAVPHGSNPGLSRPDDLTVLLRAGSGPVQAGADGVPSMVNHQVSVAVDVDEKKFVTAQRSGAQGWCAKIVTVDGDRVFRKAFKLEPGQECTTGADGGADDPSVTPTTIVSDAESDHNRTIPVSWDRIDVPSLTGYMVSCEAPGQTTRTATVTGNTDEVAGAVVTAVTNGVTYTCTVTGIPVEAATAGSDTATPSAYCLPSGQAGPAGWGTVGHCAAAPTACTDDCPNTALHNSYNAFRLSTLVANLSTTAGGTVMDIANDPARKRLLAVTASTKVYAIDPFTGSVTLLHDRNPAGRTGAGSLCPSYGNTSCGAYTAITVIGDYAYLLFGSTTDGNCGLGRCPYYSDVVRLDLTADSPVNNALPLVCTGGSSSAIVAPTSLPYVTSGSAHPWGKLTTAMTSDGTQLFLAVDSAVPTVRVLDPATTPIGPPSPTTYPASLEPSRYDFGSYPGYGQQRACDRLPIVATPVAPGGRIAGLQTEGSQVWALTASGGFYRMSKNATNATPTAWATFPINGSESAQRWIEATGLPIRESLSVFGGYVYWTDGTTLLRTSTADPSDTISLAGSIQRTVDGVGTAAGMTQGLGMVWVGETVFLSDGKSIRVGYGVDNLPPVTYSRSTYTSSASPNVATVAVNVPATPASNIDISADGRYLYVASSTQVSEIRISDGQVRDSGCVRPTSSIKNFGFVRWAAPDFLLITESTGYTTSTNLSITSCNTDVGGQSPSWVSANTAREFVVSSDGKTLWMRPGTSGQSLTRVSRQLWNLGSSSSGIGAGVWTPTNNYCSYTSHTTATASGIARLCQRSAPYSPAFEYTVMPYNATSGQTVASIAAATGRTLCVSSWAAVGDTMYTSSGGAAVSRWPVLSPPAAGCGTAVATMPRSVQGMVGGSNELFVLSAPSSGTSAIYRVSG